MKIKYIFLWLILMVFGFANTPEQAITGLLNNIKENKYEKASEYIAAESEITTLEDNTSKIQEKFLDGYAKNLEYEILEKIKVGNDYKFKVKIINMDLAKVINRLFENALKEPVKDDEELTDEYFDKTLSEIINSERVPKSRKYTDFMVIKSGNTYKVNLNIENLKAIFIGSDDLLKDLPDQ